MGYKWWLQERWEQMAGTYLQKMNLNERKIIKNLQENWDSAKNKEKSWNCCLRLASTKRKACDKEETG